MASRALSDEDASKEMKKMVTFIMQEANEKAKEITIKADEEFNIEKAKLVRQETSMIESNFARRLNQADVKRKIALSNQTNKLRLKILQFRDDKLIEITNQAEKSLTKLRDDPSIYSSLLHSLCLETYYRLMETDVTIECLLSDVEIVKQATVTAADIFEEVTGICVKVTVNGTLSEDHYGGIRGSCKGGRITCSNTLRDRLNNLGDKALPEIRNILFGNTEAKLTLN